jgi:hypothetical protein
MSTTYPTRSTGSRSAADAALADILQEIAVPRAVLKEAKDRRDLVLEIAMEHDAARARYVSGSVAHGTDNKPLEDADCGVKINRRFEEFRMFGPDAPNGGKGPEQFIQMFADLILPQLRQRGYPNAEVNLEGNRAIKFEFNEPVDIDDWGVVDPYVDLIVGLSRADGDGLWIPNRRRNGWDPADPEFHTWLMTERDEKSLRVFRAHLLRLAKRAVKRDGVVPGRMKIMYSWNLSALALDWIDEQGPLAAGLAQFFTDAADSIAIALTEDPSSVVEEPLKLPDGVTRDMAAQRLREMAVIVTAAMNARSPAGARNELEKLYGPEIEDIRAREQRKLNRGLRSGDGSAVASVLGVPTAPKRTRSDGD